MILKTTIAANVIRKGLVHASSISEINSFQYLESEIRKAIERVTIREMVASFPPTETTPEGKEVCMFEIAATTILMYN